MGRAALSLKQKNPHFLTLTISSFHHVKIIAFVWQHESQCLETFNRGKKKQCKEDILLIPTTSMKMQRYAVL